jgi:hypothetical protein
MYIDCSLNFKLLQTAVRVQKQKDKEHWQSVLVVIVDENANIAGCGKEQGFKETTRTVVGDSRL